MPPHISNTPSTQYGTAQDLLNALSGDRNAVVRDLRSNHAGLLKFADGRTFKIDYAAGATQTKLTIGRHHPEGRHAASKALHAILDSLWFSDVRKIQSSLDDVAGMAATIAADLKRDFPELERRLWPPGTLDVQVHGENLDLVTNSVLPWLGSVTPDSPFQRRKLVKASIEDGRTIVACFAQGEQQIEIRFSRKGGAENRDGPTLGQRELERMLALIPDHPSPFDRLTVYRMMLAGELGLPGETRPVTEEQWLSAGIAEQDFCRVRDTVLRVEAQDDFVRLRHFMAAWKPWQQYVRRRDSAWIENLNLSLQRMLNNATQMTNAGEMTGATFQEVAADLPRLFDQAFRDRCRTAYDAVTESASVVATAGSGPAPKIPEAVAAPAL